MSRTRSADDPTLASSTLPGLYSHKLDFYVLRISVWLKMDHTQLLVFQIIYDSVLGFKVPKQHKCHQYYDDNKTRP